MNTAAFGGFRIVYASHLPSGENSEFSRPVDCRSPNRVDFRSPIEYVHRETPEGETTLLTLAKDYIGHKCQKPGNVFVEHVEGRGGHIKHVLP